MPKTISKTTSENLKNMILYWIEVNHVWGTLVRLIDDVDEIGEFYETSSWLMNHDGEHMTMLDVNVHLERAEQISLDLVEFLNESFPDVIKLCVKVLPEIFGKYQDRVNENIAGQVAERLLEANVRDDIYAYRTDTQYENFCNYVQKCCDEIFAEQK